ncbi:MAG: hypothetical protein ABEI31_03565 [Halodesulfurarchaeum sp.]
MAGVEHPDRCPICGESYSRTLKEHYYQHRKSEVIDRLLEHEVEELRA